MSQSRIPSPARSLGAPRTPRRTKSRTRSVGSPARSTTSGRLSALIQFKENNKDSFVLSPAPSRRSVLNDNTDIEEPRRRSWWKNLADNSRDVMEVLNDNKIVETNEAVEEFIDIEVLSQEKKNYSIDIPDSSDSESINSIVIPQRKLFTQKDHGQNKFGHVIGARETLAKLHKSHVADKTVNVAPKNLFGQGTKPRTKPVFPAALLNISPNKTANKTKENVAEVKGQVRNLFGNRAGTKRKNMFADFIVSESEDEISEIQPRVFGFPKKADTRRESANSRGKREHSPTSSVTTDIEMDDWKMLPSSTMVENQLEDMMAAKTPVKRARLSKLADIKESEKKTAPIEKEPSDEEQELKYEDDDDKSEQHEQNEHEIDEVANEDNNDNNDYQRNVQLESSKSKHIKEKEMTIENSKLNQEGIQNLGNLHNITKEKVQKLNQSKTLNVSQQKNYVSHKKVNESQQKLSQENPVIFEEAMELESEMEQNKSHVNKNKSHRESQVRRKENADKINKQNEVIEHSEKQLPETDKLENIDNIDGKNQDILRQAQHDNIDAEVDNCEEDLAESIKENNPQPKEVITERKQNESVLKENSRDSNADVSDKLEINNSEKAEDASHEESRNNSEMAAAEADEVEDEEEQESPEEEDKAQEESEVQNESETEEQENELEDPDESEKEDQNESEEEIQNESEVNEQDDESEEDELPMDDQEENDAEQNLSEMEVQNESEVQDQEESEVEAQNESEAEQQNESLAEAQNESAVKNESNQEIAEDEVNNSEQEVEGNDEQNESEAENENDEAQNESEVDMQEESAEVEGNDEQIESEAESENDEGQNESEVDIQEESAEVQDELQEDAQNESNDEQDEMEDEEQNESAEIQEEEEEDEVQEDTENEVQNEGAEIQEDTEGDVQTDSQEVQEESEDEIQDSNDHQESDNDQERNVTHDTTGRHRKKNVTEVNSPEAILHDKTNHIESFTAQGRNSSVRKTTMLKNLNIKPSLAPPRESTGLSDGTRNSSAEGSGWDSHRTTRKTLRQTFGRDFTPRKSLRALVMEKSAKRQTAVNELTSVTAKFPQANSTELPEASMAPDDSEISESNHDVSKRTRQTTLEMYLQKIKKQNMERKLKMEEAVKNSLKAPPRDLNPFKVPAKPMFSTRKPNKVASKPKAKPVKSTLIPLDDLPAEVIEDMKYKPPKRFQPSNASWITKRLYKFLESKLESKYDYKARVRAEKLVETIYHFCKDLRRVDVAPNPAVDALKHEMARLDVVKTHFDFYQFFHEYMPREIRVKVVPDVVNKINVPRQGVFSDIIRGNTVQG